MKKIYCFNNGGKVRCLLAIALAEDGRIIASNVCNTEEDMPHDLGITSTWKHNIYNEYFGKNNWQLEWIDDGTRNLGFQKALELNSEKDEWERV